MSAHSDPFGFYPRGHVRARGDADGDGDGSLEPFTLEGEVTCLNVNKDKAAIKYRFKHATGSLALFEGGGVQIFLDDNGEPGKGLPDANDFDPPELEGEFQLLGRDSMCSDPTARNYDPIDHGNFTVRDALP